jgi:hypothetical protein
MSEEMLFGYIITIPPSMLVASEPKSGTHQPFAAPLHFHVEDAILVHVRLFGSAPKP